MRRFLVLNMLFLLVFTSCHMDKTGVCPEPESEAISNQFSELFNLSKSADGYVLNTRVSWENNDTKQFILSRIATDCSNQIQIPVERCLVFTGSSVFMVDTLGKINTIVGFGNSGYTGNSKLLNGISNGGVKELGDFSSADIESMILLKPDIIIVSGTGTTDPKIQRLEEAGYPVLETVEWMEKNPLGMAEWIKVYGALFDQLDRANNIFENIRSNYDSLKHSAESLPTSGQVLYDQNYGGTWYVPGQKSYVANIFKDANIPYPYKPNDAPGSVVKDVEVILKLHLNDTVWISPGVRSLDELESSDERHALFKAFQIGNVFQYDKRQGPNGTTMYWEERVLRCDWLLEDFIKMAHKGRNAKGLHFFRKLEKK